MEYKMISMTKTRYKIRINSLCNNESNETNATDLLQVQLHVRLNILIS